MALTLIGVVEKISAIAFSATVGNRTTIQASRERLSPRYVNAGAVRVASRTPEKNHKEREGDRKS